MSHKRGEITSHIDNIFEQNRFYRVYTGCQWLDDFYTCEDIETAQRISNELTGI